MKNLGTKLILAATGLAGASLVAKADILGASWTAAINSSGNSPIDYSASSVGASSSPSKNYGYEFQVTSTIQVAGLAVLNTAGLTGGTASGSGVPNLNAGSGPNGVNVGLYTVNPNTGAATEISLNSYLTSGANLAVHHALVPQGTTDTAGTVFAETLFTQNLTLAPGYYAVVANDNYVAVEGSSIGWATAPSVSFIGSAKSGTKNFDASTTLTLGNEAVSPSSEAPGASTAVSYFGANIILAVPEPSQTLAGAMLLSCGGLVFAGRRLLKKGATKA